VLIVGESGCQGIVEDGHGFGEGDFMFPNVGCRFGGVELEYLPEGSIWSYNDTETGVRGLWAWGDFSGWEESGSCFRTNAHSCGETT
jgi:hypothetical protein